jgi:hypothetical protein
MSYTKHTWADGELVTAAKMNNIENGIEEASSGGGSGGGDGAVEIPTTYLNDTRTLGMTYNECLQLKNAYFCYHTYDGNNNYTSTNVCYLTYVGEHKGHYQVCFVVTSGFGNTSELIFYADTPDGYPTSQDT